MLKPIKIAIGGSIAAIVGYLLFKGTVLKESAENIRVSLFNLPKIHKIDFGGLKIAVDLRIDNPAKASVKIKIPSVRMFYKGNLVASTAINDKTYMIDPVSTGKITGIMIEAGYVSLLTTAPGIITDFTASGSNIINNFGFEVLAEVNGIPIKVQKL
jgi:hypothetical protein